MNEQAQSRARFAAVSESILALTADDLDELRVECGRSNVNDGPFLRFVDAIAELSKHPFQETAPSGFAIERGDYSHRKSGKPVLTVEELDARLLEVGFDDFAQAAEDGDWHEETDGDDWLDEVCEAVVGEWADELETGDVLDALHEAVNAHRPLLRERLNGAIEDYVSDLKNNCECTVGASYCSTCRAGHP